MFTHFGRVSRAVTFAAITLLLLTLSLCSTSAEEPPVYSRLVDVPGAGTLMYYAQNDPTWAMTRYIQSGSGPTLVMKTGGCGPTALSMAVWAQFSGPGLSELTQFARDPQAGFVFCPCAVNARFHSGAHEVLSLRTDEDFAAYLPAAIAGYAAGNNPRRHTYANPQGTTVSLIRDFAVTCGLDYRTCADLDEAKAALEDGYSIVTTVGRGPFTGSSHFLCIASIEDGFIYVLDPLMRTEYKQDKRHVLEILEPGLVRVSERDLGRISFGTFYLLKYVQ